MAGNPGMRLQIHRKSCDKIKKNCGLVLAKKEKPSTFVKGF
jgi:hypothetical protein